jgi:hypothetical protein
MAERLKRYRPLGVTVPTVPTVDYVATGRAQSRAYGAIASGLDRMTDFALKRFEEKALIEGAEYGAANAPTLKQLQDAQGDIEDVVPGDQTTVFGRAARKAALASMNVNFEVAAREDLLNLQMQAQLEDMDTATFTEKSDAIIDGYTSTLQDVSPSTALKFRATMATVGNSALLAHAKDQIEKQQKAEQFVITSGMDIIVNGDETRGIPSRAQQIVSEGSTTTYDEFGDMQHVSMAQKIDAARNGLKEMAFSVKDKAAAEKYLKAFDDSIDLAMETEVANFVLISPIKNLNQLKSGNIEDRKMQDLWNNMSAPQRAKAKKAAFDALTEEHARETQIEAQLDRELQKRAKVAYVDIVDALSTGDNEKRDAALSELRITDPDKYADFKKRIDTGEVDDDKNTVILLEQQLANQRLRPSTVVTEFINGNLSLTTFKSYMGSATALSDKRYQAAGKRAKNILGLPDVPLINARGKDREAQQAVAGIMVELQEKQFDPKTPEDFDPIAFADKRAREVFAEMNKATDKEIAEAEKKLPKIAKALGLSDFENATYDEVKAAFAKSTNQRIKNTYSATMGILAEANE